MYDLEIVMAVSSFGKYSIRLKDFKKHGFIEISGKNRIRLYLLVGTENITNICNGWPQGIDVIEVKSQSDQCAAKMNGFYAKHKMDDAKWMMRVDDDSITKIDPLINILKQLDYNETIYLTTQLTIGDTSVEMKLLKEINSTYKNDPLWHEIECCIISKRCFNKILNNKKTSDLLLERSKIQSGYTDICLAACARECGIFPSPFYYITHEPEIKGFLENRLVHIHYVSNDVNSCEFAIAINDRSNCLLCRTKLILYEINSSNVSTKNYSVFLNSNGIIESTEEVFSFWTLENESSIVKFYNKSKWSEQSHTTCELQFVFNSKTLETMFVKKENTSIIVKTNMSYFI